MIRRAVPALLALLALSACAERPFVNAYPADLAKLAAADLAFDVCYPAGADPAEIRAVAEEVCADRGLTAQALVSNRWQCRVTAPHTTRFACR